MAEAAQALVGVPFQRQGRSRAGLDCVGLVVTAAQSVGVDLSGHDTTAYGPIPSATDLRRRLELSLDPVEELAVGCVALLTVPELGATHVGVVAERNGSLTLVHAVNSRGQVVEHRLDSHLRRAIEKTYTLRGAM